jgi:DHA1 family multidrug resistance protein-like MFS transporter
MGLFMVSFTAGFGVGPLIGGVLKDAFGIGVTFFTLSGAALVALLFVAILMPSQSASSDADEEDVPSMRVLVRDLRVWALFVFNFTFGLSMGSVMTFIAIFMTDSLLASATLVGLVVGSRAILSSVMQPFFGRLADSVPRHYMVVAGGLLLAAATWAIPAAPTIGILMVCFLLLGLAESASLPASLAITTDLGRVYGYGTLIGFSNAVLVFGLLVGSLGSSMVETVVGIEDVFHVAGIVTALMIGAFMVVWSRGSRGVVHEASTTRID